jgi:hypothetical protein
MSTNLELSKTRDFGEIISDTFLFVRENFKPLLKCFFIFCGFFMLASFAVNTLQQSKMIGMMNSITMDPNSYNSPTGTAGMFSKFFGVEYMLTMLFIFLEIAAITVTVISYLTLYKSKGNIAPTPEEVWGYFKFHYFKIFGSMIVIGVIIGVATVCCVIPGIYLYPILSLILPIMIVENTGLGYAFSQSFRLIKDNWWSTFGALFVITVVVYVLMLVVIIPASLFTVGSMFLHAGSGIHISLTAIIITTFLSVICHVFYILPLVTLSLCYFNLTEIKDATGLMGKIDQLGTNGPDTNLPAEEY